MRFASTKTSHPPRGPPRSVEWLGSGLASLTLSKDAETRLQHQKPEGSISYRLVGSNGLRIQPVGDATTSTRTYVRQLDARPLASTTSRRIGRTHPPALVIAESHEETSISSARPAEIHADEPTFEGRQALV